MSQLRTITGLQIGSLIFDGSNYIPRTVSGLEMPKTRLPRYNLPGASGAYISNALYGERLVQIKGYVHAPDGKRTTLLANRTTLINSLAYQYDSNGLPLPTTVIFTLENGQVLTMNAYMSDNMPLQLNFSEDQVDYEDFLITLISPNYTLASQTAINGTVNLPVSGPTTGIGGVLQTVGTGQHDLTSGGVFTDVVGHTYTILIHTDGSHFQFKVDSGAYSADIAITGSAQTLANGVTVTFGHTSGYTVTDTFTIVATYGIYTAIPLSLASSSGGSLVINNIGSANAFPIITLTSVLNTPYIANQTTGGFLRINRTINLGDSNIIINCANQTVFQGVNNITGAQSFDSTFWSLVTGNNTIAFSAAGGTGNATISFYPVFLGV
jgi:hypothetical protein